MGVTRTFTDAFAPRKKAQGKDGFGRPKDVAPTPEAKAPVDRFKPAPAPPKALKQPKPAKPPKPPKASAALAPKTDAFAPKPKPVKPARPAAFAGPAPVSIPVPASVKAFPRVKQPAADRPAKGWALGPGAGRRQKALQPAKPAARKTAFTPVAPSKPFALVPAQASAKPKMTRPVEQVKDKSRMVRLAAAGATATGLARGSGFNPFARKPAAPKAPGRTLDDTLATPAPAAQPLPDLFAAQASTPEPAPLLPPVEVEEAPAPRPEVRRAPLHVVASAPVSEPVAKPVDASRARTAMRSSSLVLVSGAGAATAAASEAHTVSEAVDAPKPSEAPAAAPAATETATAAPAAAPKTGGGSGGGSGSEPPAAKAQSRRGFNQDDLFGVIFGVAVLAFLLLWLMRGRAEDVPADDQIVTAQAAANTLAATPPPAPLVDPFGNAPVDLRPTGPIPEPPQDLEAGTAAAPPAEPEAAPPQAAAPVPATPAPAAVPQPVIPLAERRMHAWFCTSSATITKASRAAIDDELERFADVFQGKELVVRGYADTRGTTEYNSLLGGERARVVADFLRTKGLTIAEFSGIGELEGLDDNQNCPNQRRVDVWVKGSGADQPSRACIPDPESEPLICPR